MTAAQASCQPDIDLPYLKPELNCLGWLSWLSQQHIQTGVTLKCGRYSMLLVNLPGKTLQHGPDKTAAGSELSLWKVNGNVKEVW